MIRSLSGAGTRPACTDLKPPANKTGYTCASCPTGYDSPAKVGNSGSAVCADTNACSVSATQTCLSATSSTAAQAQVKQLCGAYGVRVATIQLCLALKISQNTCNQVGAMAVQYFGAGKEPSRCAVEAAKLSSFCGTLAKALPSGSPCSNGVKCADLKARLAHFSVC